MEFDTSFPADREAFELVEQGEGLLDDVAELAQAEARTARSAWARGPHASNAPTAPQQRHSSVIAQPPTAAVPPHPVTSMHGHQHAPARTGRAPATVPGAVVVVASRSHNWISQAPQPLSETVACA